MSPPVPYNSLVPAAVAARADELFGAAAGTSWCTTAAASLEECVSRWGLSLVAPVAGGRGGLLWRASTADRELAVKVPFTGPVAHFDALQLLADAGVGPAVVARDDQAGVCASAWVPGAPIGRRAFGSDAAASVVRRLAELRDATSHLEPPSPLPSLEGWLRSRLEAPPDDVAPGSRRPAMRERAGALDLLADLGDVGSFCHGDANPGNVLVAPDGGVWLLDARGVTGDVCFDVAVFTAKTHRAVTVTGQLAAVARLARDGGFDVERCRAWLHVARAAQV